MRGNNKLELVIIGLGVISALTLALYWRGTLWGDHIFIDMPNHATSAWYYAEYFPGIPPNWFPYWYTGKPFPGLYPPFPYFIGGVFYSLSRDPFATTKVMCLLSIILSGFLAFLTLRHLVGDWKPALLGAAVWIAAHNRLVIMGIGNYPKLFSSIFLWLLLYSLAKLQEEVSLERVLVLSVVVAGLLLSNVTEAILGFVLGVLWWFPEVFRKGTWKFIWAALAGALLGVGLAAFWWVEVIVYPKLFQMAAPVQPGATLRMPNLADYEKWFGMVPLALAFVGLRYYWNRKPALVALGALIFALLKVTAPEALVTPFLVQLPFTYALPLGTLGLSILGSYAAKKVLSSGKFSLRGREFILFALIALVIAEGMYHAYTYPVLSQHPLRSPEIQEFLSPDWKYRVYGPEYDWTLSSVLPSRVEGSTLNGWDIVDSPWGLVSFVLSYEKSNLATPQDYARFMEFLGVRYYVAKKGDVRFRLINSSGRYVADGEVGKGYVLFEHVGKLNMCSALLPTAFVGDKYHADLFLPVFLEKPLVVVEERLDLIEPESLRSYEVVILHGVDSPVGICPDYDTIRERVLELAEEGKTVILCVDGTTCLYESELFGVTVHLGKLYGEVSYSGSVAGVDYSRFSPAIWEGGPWNFAYFEGGRTLLRVENYSVVVERELKNGKIIFVGYNLPYHATYHENAEEVLFLRKLLVRGVKGEGVFEPLDATNYVLRVNLTQPAIVGIPLTYYAGIRSSEGKVIPTELDLCALYVPAGEYTIHISVGRTDEERNATIASLGLWLAVIALFLIRMTEWTEFKKRLSKLRFLLQKS